MRFFIVVCIEGTNGFTVSTRTTVGFSFVCTNLVGRLPHKGSASVTSLEMLPRSGIAAGAPVDWMGFLIGGLSSRNACCKVCAWQSGPVSVGVDGAARARGLTVEGSGGDAGTMPLISPAALDGSPSMPGGAVSRACLDCVLFNPIVCIRVRNAPPDEEDGAAKARGLPEERSVGDLETMPFVIPAALDGFPSVLGGATSSWAGFVRACFPGTRGAEVWVAFARFACGEVVFLFPTRVQPRLN
jgi:hypothetical protein